MQGAYNLGCRLIAGIKIPHVFQKLFCENQLTIVMYHGIVKSPLKIYDWCFIEENSFRIQIEYLKKHFEILSLPEAVERMKNGEIERPTAVITFDDGYQNNFDIAFPILRREGIPASIFLTTGLTNTNDTVWQCRLNLALSQTSKSHIEWNGSRFDLSTAGLRANASATIQESLKKIEHSQLMAAIRNIILKLDDDPDRPIEIGSPFRMLDKMAIAEMVASGLIEFGAHTHHHAILSLLSKKERCYEISETIKWVHEVTGLPCRYFAYPNGRLEDYDIETIQDLRAYGIQIAVTTISGPNNIMTPAMELRRYGVGADLTMAKFQLMVHHFISAISGGINDRRALPANQDND